MDTNPAIKMYRKMLAMNEKGQEPTKETSGGLLSRSDKKVKSKSKPDPKTEVAERVARYVNDIRNYNA
jgi:hypothetical protein|tara:strand:- start:552 stop:755 length:204 start_codon:yes stop_codon:yes gene_type:complete